MDGLVAMIVGVVILPVWIVTASALQLVGFPQNWEQEVLLPPQLATSPFVILRDAAVIEGKLPSTSGCRTLKKVGRMIEEAEDQRHGSDYKYHQPGVTHSVVPAGTRLYAKQVVSCTGYRFFSIFDGPWPIYFLILEDESGKRFTIATIDFGLNENDRFVGLHLPSGLITVGPDDFAQGRGDNIFFEWVPSTEHRGVGGGEL